MAGLLDLLSGSTPLLLFSVVGIGYFLGNVRIGGFTLDEHSAARDCGGASGDREPDPRSPP